MPLCTGSTSHGFQPTGGLPRHAGGSALFGRIACAFSWEITSDTTPRPTLNHERLRYLIISAATSPSEKWRNRPPPHHHHSSRHRTRRETPSVWHARMNRPASSSGVSSLVDCLISFASIASGSSAASSSRHSSDAPCATRKSSRPIFAPSGPGGNRIILTTAPRALRGRKKLFVLGNVWVACRVGIERKKHLSGIQPNALQVGEKCGRFFCVPAIDAGQPDGNETGFGTR